WRERIDLEVLPAGVRVDVTGEGSDTLPRDETHLVVRCVTEGLSDLGVRAPGLALRGHNTIPHGRGLGSSSAAIVAGLVAARALARRRTPAGPLCWSTRSPRTRVCCTPGRRTGCTSATASRPCPRRTP